VPAIGEFRRVLQVLLNLLSNAIRYTPEKTIVRLDCGLDGGAAWIAVEDSGQGLTGPEAARVFEKFERLGRKGDGGSGLGLYISRRLARAMAGDLTVTSTPGEGARFCLRLPPTFLPPGSSTRASLRPISVQSRCERDVSRLPPFAFSLLISLPV
jgi:signal transduction histidine kinase